MKTDDLSYINGFLQAMALVNVGTNHGCWYYIEPVKRRLTLNESLNAHFEEFFERLSSKYGTKDHALQVLFQSQEPVLQVLLVYSLWYIQSVVTPELQFRGS